MNQLNIVLFCSSLPSSWSSSSERLPQGFLSTTRLVSNSIQMNWYFLLKTQNLNLFFLLGVELWEHDWQECEEHCGASVQLKQRRSSSDFWSASGGGRTVNIIIIIVIIITIIIAIIIFIINFDLLKERVRQSTSSSCHHQFITNFELLHTRHEGMRRSTIVIAKYIVPTIVVVKNASGGGKEAPDITKMNNHSHQSCHHHHWW